MKWITNNGRRFPINKYPSLTDLRYLQNQDAYRTFRSNMENEARKKFLVKRKVVEKKREWGVKIGALGSGFEYKRGITETVTKEKK
ncbi:hypothetical protein [Nitrososphaera viennensis]|uniref:Uncharacterized protein n=2 Tax=Nitrososphaera viennensis TaxID=1034015 RepID=A0A060HNR2_9ARCH|nr:hypothetical protein [Nitrososphaera viennensis]AIC14832.1 hypothetical protein NVIE_006280 [Nitrososphaera viennensis EN76]UVS69784.1 hypothetical protein NWT39_03110 [Nitrososphaera viennensis]